MKIYFISALLFFAAITTKAQTTTAQAVKANAENISNTIAVKMKDGLQLTESQKTQLYNINVQLHNEKMEARKLYSNADTLTVYIQRIENKRDGLYRAVLGEEKYLQYRKQKETLVDSKTTTVQ